MRGSDGKLCEGKRSGRIMWNGSWMKKVIGIKMWK